jgi:hypothetical protein
MAKFLLEKIFFIEEKDEGTLKMEEGELNWENE